MRPPSPPPLMPYSVKGDGVSTWPTRMSTRRLHQGRVQIVAEQRVLQLAVLVIVEVLVEGAADAVHGAAPHVAGERHRVDHGAAVVDRHVVQEIDLAGLGIHLHHRDVTHVAHDRIEDAEVGAVLRRHGRDRMVVDVGRVDAAGEVVVLRQVQPEVVGVQRHLGQRLLLAGHALDADGAVAEFEIARVRLQHVAGDTQHLLLDHVGGAAHRARDHHREAAAARTPTS